MAFGSVIFTNRGKVLQSKAQAGVALNFTKLAIGDGELGGQSVLELNDLKNKKIDIPISSIKVLTGGIASVGGTFTNQNLATGFYWRELGLFAQDPDLGEVLYCYGNAGALAEYIPASGGSEILEKRVDIEAIVGNAESVSATIDSSLVFATVEDIERHNTNEASHPYLNQQIRECLNLINGIDVSADVRGVINERVNSDTTKPLNAVIGGLVDTAKTAVLNAITTLTGHVTGKATAIINHVTSKVDTLPQKSIWTDARGAKLDNLNVSVSSARDSVNTNVDQCETNVKNHVTTKTTEIKNAIAAKGAIKSVQRGQVDIGQTATSTVPIDTNGFYYTDITISAVNVSKAFVLINSSTETHEYDYQSNARLVNATTLRIYANRHLSSWVYFSNYVWQVVEFN